MAAGELQSCNRSINGSVRRFSSVFLSYSFREASRVVCNLGEREPKAVGVVLDMAISTK